MGYGTFLVGFGAVKWSGLSGIVKGAHFTSPLLGFTLWDLLEYLLLLLLVSILAFVTNPNDESFKTYLTDLSFHRHLRRLHYLSSRKANPTDSHVLTFSNRVCLSIRTPSYVRRNYGLFSTVTMVPAAGDVTSASSVQCLKHRHTQAHQRKSTVEDGVNEDGDCCESSIGVGGSGCKDYPYRGKGGFFVGAFGRWWAWDDGTNDEVASQKSVVEAGVIGMQSLDKDDAKAIDDGVSTTSSESDGIQGKAKSSRSKRDILARLETRANSKTFRAGQRRSSPSPRSTASPAKGKATDQGAGGGRQNDGKPDSNSKTSQNEGNGAHSSTEFMSTHSDRNLPGLPFHVSRDEMPGQLPLEDNRKAKAQGSSFGAITNTNDPLTENVLAELHAQIDDAQSQSAAAQIRLQTELDELRTRKREEDGVRAELRSRSRILEESKRSADQDYAKAEKRLQNAKAANEAVESRIEEMTSRMEVLKKREKELAGAYKKALEAKKEKETSLREEIAKKKKELVSSRDKVESLIGRVKFFEGSITDKQAEVAAKETAARMETSVPIILKRPPPTGPRSLTGDSSSPKQASSPPANAPTGPSMMSSVNAASTSTSTSTPSVTSPTTASKPASRALTSPPPTSPKNKESSAKTSAPPSTPLSKAHTFPGPDAAGSVGSGRLQAEQQHSSPSVVETQSPKSHPLSSPGPSGTPPPGLSHSIEGQSPGEHRSTSSIGSPSSFTGFLEHRLQHRRVPASLSSEDPSFSNATSSSVVSTGVFAPFDSPMEVSRSANIFDDPHGMPLTLSVSSVGMVPPIPSGNNVWGDMPTYSTTTTSRPISSEGENSLDSPSFGPLSPMTPHQASLIPATLFQLLDDDTDDAGIVDSPTKSNLGRGREGDGVLSGLGIGDVDGTRVVSGATGLGLKREIDLDGLLSSWSSAAHTTSTASGNNVGFGHPGLSSFGVGRDRSKSHTVNTPLSRSPVQTSSSVIQQGLKKDAIGGGGGGGASVKISPSGGTTLNPDAKAFDFHRTSTTKPSTFVPSVNRPAYTLPVFESGSNAAGVGLGSSYNAGAGAGAGMGSSPFDFDDILRPVGGRRHTVTPSPPLFGSGNSNNGKSDSGIAQSSSTNNPWNTQFNAVPTATHRHHGSTTGGSIHGVIGSRSPPVPSSNSVAPPTSAAPGGPPGLTVPFMSHKNASALSLGAVGTGPSTTTSFNPFDEGDGDELLSGLGFGSGRPSSSSG